MLQAHSPASRCVVRTPAPSHRRGCAGNMRAAGKVQRRAGDESRCVRCKEEDGWRNVLGLSGTPDGVGTRGQPTPGAHILATEGVAVGVHQARGNVVDRNAKGSVLDREVADEVLLRGFRHRIIGISAEGAAS